MQLFHVCSKENPKKIKYGQSAVLNLERCSKEAKVGLYANFALLYLSFRLQKEGYKVNGIQDPKNYASLIEKDGSARPDKYEGLLAFAYIRLKSQPNDGVKELLQLIKLNDQRPEAYFVLTNFYLDTKDFKAAAETAGNAYNNRQNFETFHDRILAVILYAKCL